MDFSSRVLRDESALDYMNKFPSDEEARENMIGLSVMATYGNNRIYRIDDIDLSQTAQSKFEYKDKGELKQISFENYFKEKYNKRITDKY